MCLLTSGPVKSCGASVPGVRKVWLARKANSVSYRYANDDFSIIDWIMNAGGNPTPFHEFEADIEFAQSTEELQIDTAGKSFPQNITMRFAAMAREKRAVFESVIYDQCVCVYLDRNSRYWLLGQDHGLKTVEYSATSDRKSGANGYVFKLVGREKQLQREVNGVNFTIYTSPNSPGSGQSGARITNLGGSGPNGGITAVLNTWTAQPFGGPPMPLSQLGDKPIIEIIQ
jgi:hypothetical protein